MFKNKLPLYGESLSSEWLVFCQDMELNHSPFFGVCKVSIGSRKVQVQISICLEIVLQGLYLHRIFFKGLHSHDHRHSPASCGCVGNMVV